MNPCVRVDGVEDYLAGGDGSAINHTDEREVTVRLVLPGGIVKTLYQGQQLVWSAGNAITIFDGEADKCEGSRRRIYPHAVVTFP